MKLWEVLKTLEENPGKEFETAGREWKLYANGNNYLYLERYSCGIRLDRTSGAGGFNGNFRAYDAYDWQEVKTPVTWQEAIEAWADYKTIYCIDSDGQRWTYEWHNKKTKGLDSLEDGIGVSPDEIKLGTWYIKEGE